LGIASIVGFHGFEAHDYDFSLVTAAKGGGRDVAAADATAAGIDAEQGRRLLLAAQKAWNTRDLEALVNVLDPNICIDVNLAPPIQGIEAARAWLRARLDVQLDYRLVKELRGVYDNTVVCHWTGTWHEASGGRYRAVGIELLTLNAENRVTRWEAATDTEHLDA
jgi:nuclear transport factor 2 (NTF2) superfamily protein